MKPKHKWNPITIRMLCVDGDSPEYRKYAAWCERMGLPRAPFDVWLHETNAINANSGIKFINKSNYS